MFPHPQDLLASACKVQRDNDLMIAAGSTTLTPYPRSLTLVDEESLRRQATNPGLVIKRDYSDGSLWTFLPKRDDKDGRARREHIRKRFLETQKCYQHITQLPYPSWLAQPYMPGLVEKGEIRAFLVGGKLRYAIHTWPGPNEDLYMDLVENYTPLNLLE